MEPAHVRTHPLVTVVSRNGQLAVVARRDLRAGTEVLAIDGPVVAKSDRYTVQIGAGEHVDGGADASGEFPVWRFLNHACEPNTRIAGRSLRARRDLQAGDEVTFDYDTTEWDMAAPFPCACGAPTCRGLIRGYRHLTPAQREALADAAPHLRDAFARVR
jgi:hypothetical protein